MNTYLVPGGKLYCSIIRKFAEKQDPGVYYYVSPSYLLTPIYAPPHLSIEPTKPGISMHLLVSAKKI